MDQIMYTMLPALPFTPRPLCVAFKTRSTRCKMHINTHKHKHGLIALTFTRKLETRSDKPNHMQIQEPLIPFNYNPNCLLFIFYNIRYNIWCSLWYQRFCLATFWSPRNNNKYIWNRFYLEITQIAYNICLLANDRKDSGRKGAVRSVRCAFIANNQTANIHIY